jgi:hypothetical protein
MMSLTMFETLMAWQTPDRQDAGRLAITVPCHEVGVRKVVEGAP